MKNCHCAVIDLKEAKKQSHNFSIHISRLHVEYPHISCSSVLTLLLLVVVVLRTDDWVSSEAGSWSWRSRGGGRLDSRVRLRARWVW